MFGKLGRVVSLALALSGSTLHSQPEALPASSRDFGFRFEEVAVASGVAFRYTFGDFAYDNILESSGSGVTWLDYDLDGDIDLYLLNGVYLEGVSDPKGRAHHQAVNRLFCNSGGRFRTEHASEPQRLLMSPVVRSRGREQFELLLDLRQC